MLFTDGSAKPNPGPSGAGLVAFRDGVQVHSSSTPLGYGTNNVGELYAFGQALQYACEFPFPTLPTKPLIYLFPDSSFAIGAVTKHWKVHDSTVPEIKELLPQLAQAAKGFWRRLRSTAQLRIHWIKGHAGIHGNTLADTAADEGAARSTPEDRTRLLAACHHSDFFFQPP